MILVPQVGFAPTTYCLEGSCCYLLSYWGKWEEPLYIICLWPNKRKHFCVAPPYKTNMNTCLNLHPHLI